MLDKLYLYIYLAPLYTYNPKQHKHWRSQTWFKHIEKKERKWILCCLCEELGFWSKSSDKSKCMEENKKKYMHLMEVKINLISAKIILMNKQSPFRWCASKVRKCTNSSISLQRKKLIDIMILTRPLRT